MKILPLAVALALTSSHLMAQSGPIARYLLNNNANDSVGSNHGTIVGATPVADRFNQANAAYRFDGVGSRIEFAAVPPLNQVNNWTLSAWVKPAAMTANGLAVYIGLDNGAASDGFGFGMSSDFTLQGFVPAAAGFFSSGSVFPGTNTWSHVVMVRTNGIISFFLNGVKTPNTSSVNVSLPSDMTFGSQNGIRYFAGSLDDVRIYNRAITSNEVAQIYSGNEGPCFPHAATATPILFNGFVVGATVVDGGCGYTNEPTVTISGGGGSNATATATISNGIVTQVTITSAGCCYTNEPRLIISSPPFPTSVSIKVSKYAITQHVMVGRTYVLEGTSDLMNWMAIGSQFTAQTEDVIAEVDATLNYHFFRSREVTPSP